MSALVRLAELFGIETVWHDNDGIERTVGEETMIALLAAMGVEADSEALQREALAAEEQRQRERTLPPYVIVEPGAGAGIDQLTARVGEAFRLELEDGEERSGRIESGGRLPVEVPLGRHRFLLDDGTCELIAAPQRCLVPGDVGIGHCWGVAAQLYGLPTEPPGDVGDFGALTRAGGTFAREGAAFLGLNPLHALFPAVPEVCSPYAPSTRRWLNIFYIDIAAAAAEFGVELTPQAEDDHGELVDYATVAARKMPAFEKLFAAFERLPNATDFAAWRSRQGRPLELHCLFDALQEAALQRDPGAVAPWQWPDGWQQPGTPETEAFALEHEPRVRFFAFLQWLADRQLAAAQTAARAGGMPLGLYRDLAVGANPAGSAAWGAPALTLRGVSIGAPPDAFSPLGQSWGLAPMSPHALAQQAFRPMIDDIAASMRHSGAIRIDHVLGFNRQFWVPDGMTPKDGAYVRLPFDDLARMTALESHRHRCVVVGEDLGTLPFGFREDLDRAGMLGCRVLWFEQEGHGLRRPEHFTKQALASIATHDLPTVRGFWAGRDIDWRRRLGIFPDEDAEKASREEREHDKERIRTALRESGLSSGAASIDDDDEALLVALHRYLARTASVLVMAQLEDLAGMIEQPNLPGTIDEHPNWRRRLPMRIERLVHDSRARRILEALREERP